LKIKGKHGDEWVIHREAIHDLSQADQGVTQAHDSGDHPSSGNLSAATKRA